MFVYFVIKTSMSWRLKSASYNGTRRDQAGLKIAPQGNQQLTCHRHDGDPPNTTLGGPDALVKPDTQRTIGLVPEPDPGQFDHHCAGLRIASLADTLVAAHGTALEMARRQPNIAPELLAIVELPIEDLTSQHRGNSRSNALDLDEILNLRHIDVRGFGRDNGFTLCFNRLDHC